jgi:hypothetical protein
MDTHSSNPDDLKKLEARLASWKPAPEGLDPEAMLFAAGRASARKSKARFAWAIVCGCLGLVVAVLAVRLSAERSERLALLRELRQTTSETRLLAASSNENPVTTLPGPDSYLVLRRQWEQQPGEWTARPAEPGEEPKKPGTPDPPILRAWQPGGPVEPL